LLDVLEDRVVLQADIGGTLASALDTGIGPDAGHFSFSEVIAPANDVDMYRFYAHAGNVVVIGTRPPPGVTDPADTELRLFDSDGLQLSFDDDSGPPDLYSLLRSYTFTEDGDYYVGVDGYPNRFYDPITGTGTAPASNPGEYQLDIWLDPGDSLLGTETEGSAADTGIAGATGFYANTNKVGDGPFGNKDVDLYAFVAEAGTTLSAATFQPPGSGDADTVLQLFDAMGDPVPSAWDDDSGSGTYSALTYTFPAGGIYYLGVSGYPNGTSFNPYDPHTGGSGAEGEYPGDYRLVMGLGTPDGVGDAMHDAYEWDWAWTALYTQVGDGIFGARDVDLFQFLASPGTTLRAETFDPDGIDPVDTYLRLFNYEGTELAFDDDSGDGNYSRLTYTFTTTGYYYIGVSGYNNSSYDAETAGSGIAGSTGNYGLTMDVAFATSEWSSTWDDQGRAVAVDANGNTYVAVSSSNGNDGGSLVARYDPAGVSYGSYSFGQTAADVAYGIALDSNNNVLVTGSFDGTVDFDIGQVHAGDVDFLTSKGGKDVFVLKLDPLGNFVWVEQVGGTGSDVAYGVAVDGGDNILVTGSFSGTADFKPGSGSANLTSKGSTDVFVLKLDGAGNYLWAKSTGGTAADSGRAITVDFTGNVYVTGSFQGTADFKPGSGTANLTSKGGKDAFVWKLTGSTGGYSFARQMGGSAADEGLALALDGDGNIYTTGSFGGTAYFALPSTTTGKLTSKGGTDAFVSKMTPSGAYVWVKQLGGPKGDKGNGITVAGSVVTTVGQFSQTVDFAPGSLSKPLTSAGSTDAFVSQLTTDGDYVAARRIGGVGKDFAKGVAVDLRGNVFVTGAFSDTVVVQTGAGAVTLSSLGGTDTFVAKLLPPPQSGWLMGMGGGSDRNDNGSSRRWRSVMEGPLKAGLVDVVFALRKARRADGALFLDLG
jgi:hypothetical protein